MTDTSLKAKIETITPEKAEALLVNMNGNRRLSKTMVERLADDISHGRWILNGEAVKIAENGELLDGQHRLHAVVKAKKPISVLVVRGLTNAAFTTLDQGRSRTNADIFGMLDIPNAMLAASVARNLWEYDKYKLISQRSMPPRSEVLKSYKQHKHAIDEAATMAQTVWVKSGLGRSVTATCSVLFQQVSKHSLVEIFFEILSDRPQEHQAINALDKTIRSSHSRRRKTPTWIAITIKAWNAWRTNTPVGLLHFRANESFPDIEK